MPRGGRRPGAGAPVGNTNALKHGKNSTRVRAVVAALMADPEARTVLLGLGATKSRRDPQVRELVLTMARLMHDRTVAESARQAIDAIAEDRLAAWEADRYADDLAYYERTTGRDALTGDALTRRPRRTAAQQRLIARLRKRLIEARQRLRDWEEMHAPEPPHRFVPYLEMLQTREAEAAREEADRALLDLPPVPPLQALERGLGGEVSRDNNQPAAATAASKPAKKRENAEKQHVNQTAPLHP